MRVAEEIGRVKKENNVAILQGGRWSSIVDRVVSQAPKLGVSERVPEDRSRSHSSREHQPAEPDHEPVRRVRKLRFSTYCLRILFGIFILGKFSRRDFPFFVTIA